MAYFITSDRHFYHKNMTKEGANNLGIRDYETVAEMNADLIKAHNSAVSPDDTTIDLGDMTIGGKPAEILDIYNQMNGSFIIIKGNHDTTKVLKYLNNNNYELPNGKMKFEIHEVGYRHKQDGKVFYCTHYPMDIGMRGKVYSLHGHIHNYTSRHPYGINLGIDSPEIQVKRFGQPIRLQKAIELVIAKGELYGTQEPHTGGTA